MSIHPSPVKRITKKGQKKKIYKDSCDNRSKSNNKKQKYQYPEQKNRRKNV